MSTFVLLAVFGLAETVRQLGAMTAVKRAGGIHVFERTITALGQFEGQRQQVAFSGGDDWKNIVRDVEVSCPNCAHCADAGKWWTQEQLVHARDVAMHQISSTLSSALWQDAQSWNAHRGVTTEFGKNRTLSL